MVPASTTKSSAPDRNLMRKRRDRAPTTNTVHSRLGRTAGKTSANAWTETSATWVNAPGEDLGERLTRGATPNLAALHSLATSNLAAFTERDVGNSIRIC
jgi:hypothetical protein